MNSDILSVYQALGGEPSSQRRQGREIIVRCLSHRPDAHASLRLNRESGVWYCDPCGVGGGVLDLVMLAGAATDHSEAARWLRDRQLLAGDASSGDVVGRREWRLSDASGSYLATHHREDREGGTKVFWWSRNGSLGLGGLKAADLPLYGADVLAKSPSDGSVLVVEGEKAADALRRSGFSVVATVTGAGVTPSQASLEVLRGREIVLWPDNDDPGRKHMDRIAGRLRDIASKVRMISWGKKVGDDAADFFSSGGTTECLGGLVAQAREWRPKLASQLASAAKLIRLSEVNPEAVSWLWPGRIPFGKLTVLDGDPGLGKSTLALDLAARMTTGRELPGGAACSRGAVVLLSAEDGLADTVRPRLDAAGGDPSRFVAISTVQEPGGAETAPSLVEHVSQIEDAIRRESGRLLIVDPFMAYLGREINSYRDQDVRSVLAPLAALADRTGAAVLLVRHLRKGSRADGALYAGGGSIGISGAARSVLLVGKDPDDESRRIVAAVKSNLCPSPPSLAYRIETDGDGRPRIVWEPEPVDFTADRLLAASAEGEEERGARAEAAEWLSYYLADAPRPSAEVLREGRRAGHQEITLRRAAKGLGVQKSKDGFQGGWIWAFPVEGDQQEPKMITSRPGSSLAEPDHLRSPLDPIPHGVDDDEADEVLV
jgi:putative DNA primase/helicase